MAAVNESIGFGDTVHINDGNAAAYVLIDNLVDFTPPNETLGVVESKRLDLASGRIIKVPTIFQPGSTTLKIQFGQTVWARMEGLRKAKTKSNYKYTMLDDTSNTVIIVSGYCVSNKVTAVEADKIVEFESTIEHTGVQS